MTGDADFKRRVRAQMAGTGESYTAARAQVLGRPDELHVTNGDSTVGELAKTGLAARILPWRDALHEGPVLPGPDAVRLAARAAYVDVDVSVLEARDRELDAHDGEFVLWFEADLYDQLQIVEILARLAARGVDPGRITLISVGEVPGVARFGGLGELYAEQLRVVAAQAAVGLTADALALAVRAWDALRSPDPGAIAALVDVRSPELRFVGEAFGRLAREYPWVRDGLSLTERRLLAALPGMSSEAFLRGAAKEARPFLGDDFAFAALGRLAAGGLVAHEAAGGAGADVAPRDRLARTELGDRVLAGEAQHVTDRWVGGVRMRETAWRWDEATEGLVLRA
jgi:hypothetical protein